MYSYDARIRFSEIDSEGKLTLVSLLNYFQDCSTFQSEDLGLGVEYLKERNLVWVMSSWQIVIEEFPTLCEKVKVGTIPYNFKNFLGSRNFVMTDVSGKYFAKANSLWSLLDTRTGKPALPNREMLEGYKVEEKIQMDYAPRKIAVPEGGQMLEPVKVKKHHLDTNHHVNNGQYVAIAMEFLPDNFDIKQMRAEYKQQAFLDDEFCPYVVQNERQYVISLLDKCGKPYAIVEFLGR